MCCGKRGPMRHLLFLILGAAAVLAIPGYSQTEKPWQQLFNGKDLTGWKHVGPGNMTVENGLIQTHGGMGLLYWTPGKPGPEWNTMLITLDGPHTVVVLNDVKVTDYTEGQPVPEKKFEFEPQRGRRPNDGYMGLQNHSDNDIVFFKEVALQPL